MKLRKILTVAVTVLTLLLGASLCAAALILYLRGVRQRAEAGSGLVPIYTREAVRQQLTWVLPVFLVWLAAVIAAAVTHVCPQPGLPAMKRLPRLKPPRQDGGDAARFTLRMALLTAAVILILYGIRAGGPREVLAKAINICTECIGLG